MIVESIYSHGRRIVVATVVESDFATGIPDHCDGSNAEVRRFQRENGGFIGSLGQSVVSELCSKPHLRFDVPPMIVLDLSEIGPDFETFLTILLLPLILQKSPIIHHKGKTAVVGVSTCAKEERWKFWNGIIEPTLDSAIRNWVKEPILETDFDLINSSVDRAKPKTLEANVEKLIVSAIDADSVHSFVVGACGAIGDVGTADDDDPVVRQILAISDALPPEQ